MPALNLGRLASAVEDELQQAPDVRRWRVAIRRTLSDVYQEWYALRPWAFRIREAPLWVYPDIEVPNTDLAVPAGTTHRVFQTSDLAALLTTAGYLPSGGDEDTAWQTHRENLVGAEMGIEDADATVLGAGNWNEGPFVIEKVAAGGPGERIWLDPRCDVTSVPSGRTFNIRFPRYLLPYDCDQLLPDGIKDELGAPVTYIDHARFRAREGGTTRPPPRGGGWVTSWTYDEGVDLALPLNQRAGPNHWNASVTERPVAFDHHKNVVINETFNANVDPAVGTFVVGTRYRIAVSWYYAGRFGPLSSVVEITPTTGNQSVLLDSLPSVPSSAALGPETAYGWSLAIFIAEGDGPFYLTLYIDPAPSQFPPGFGTSMMINDPPGSFPWKKVRFEDVYTPTYRYIRLSPRPAAPHLYQLRYLRRAYPLVEDEDMPELPEQFHMGLVYEAAARICAPREGDSSRSALYVRLKAQAQAKFAEMVQYYFPGQHQIQRKGSILEPSETTYRLDLPVDWNGDQ